MKCKQCKCEIPGDNRTIISKVDLSFDVGTGISKGGKGWCVYNDSSPARLGAADWEEPHKFCSVGCMIEYLKVQASKAVFEYLKGL